MRVSPSANPPSTPRPSIATVVGARPQFIKAAVVSHALRAAGAIDELLVHTGQHYDFTLSQVFFDQLGLPAPDVNLDIGSGSHAVQTAAMLRGLEPVLERERPALVLIYGDTNSTLAAAVCAAKLNLPIAHVEAGLRSFNRRMPEEINRIVADQLSSLLFAPTASAKHQLEQEGVDPKTIHLVGDVMFDSVLAFKNRARELPGAIAARAREGGYVLATVHRAENTDDPQRLRNILDALDNIGKQLPVVFPMHPRTRERLSGLTPSWTPTAGITILEPVGYLEMLALEAGARAVLTDSGGVQKEAFFNRVPCVTVRTETEWGELVEAGWNILAPPTSADSISAAVHRALQGRTPPFPESTFPSEDLFGGGEAAPRIVSILSRFLGIPKLSPTIQPK